MIRQLLERLEKSPTCRFRKKELLGLSEGEFERLKGLGLLVYCQRDRDCETYPCRLPCSRGCSMDVMDMEGKSYAICPQDTEVDPILLSEDDLAEYRLVVEKVVAEIRGTDDYVGESYTLGPRMHFIGRRVVQGVSVALVLALFPNVRAAEPELLSLPARLLASYGEIVVVTPKLDLTAEPTYAKLRNAGIMPVVLPVAFGQGDFKIEYQMAGGEAIPDNMKGWIGRLWELNNSIKELFDTLDDRYDAWSRDGGEVDIRDLVEEFTRIVNCARAIRAESGLMRNDLVRECGVDEAVEKTWQALVETQRQVAEAEKQYTGMTEDQRDELGYTHPLEVLHQGVYEVWEDMRFDMELLCLENNVLKESKEKVRRKRGGGGAKGEPLEIRVAKVVRALPQANSDQIAKIVGSTANSVRTTKAWQHRKQLRDAKTGTLKGWKDEDGNMEAFGSRTDNPMPEHYDIYEMFQDYKSGKTKDAPTVERVAAKLGVDRRTAKALMKEAEKTLVFSFDQMD